MMRNLGLRARQNGYKGDIVFIAKKHLPLRGRIGVLYVSDNESLRIWDEDSISYKVIFSQQDDNNNNLEVYDKLVFTINNEIRDASKVSPLYINLEMKRITSEDDTEIGSSNFGNISLDEENPISKSDDVNVYYNGVLIHHQNIYIISEKIIKVVSINNIIWKNDIITVDRTK